jgi:DNA recombination protein RmuC
VKTEFGKFGTLLEKVQKNLQQAGNQIEDLMGVRTRAIENKLRKVEELPQEDADKLRLDL